MLVGPFGEDESDEVDLPLVGVNHGRHADRFVLSTWSPHGPSGWPVDRRRAGRSGTDPALLIAFECWAISAGAGPSIFSLDVALDGDQTPDVVAWGRDFIIGFGGSAGGAYPLFDDEGNILRCGAATIPLPAHCGPMTGALDLSHVARSRWGRNGCNGQ